MISNSIIQAQLDFYRKGNSGCLFAAHAANNPERYEWTLTVSDASLASIEDIVARSIGDENTSTQSIIFPSVVNEADLVLLLSTLKESQFFSLGQREEYSEEVCLGFRVHVGDLKSWLTGFGNFNFLPLTRQALFTEIVFRTKKRPEYEKVMKPTQSDVIHLADMDMKGMQENKFKALWYGSFDQTKKILGHKPDLRSAAKTTFTIPVKLCKEL